MPRKASDKSHLCGCIVCGFVDWIGGKYGERPEHDQHLWFKENGYNTSYGCLDCYNLYNARRTASTKADRTGTSSDCLCPDTRSGYPITSKELFKDVDPSRVTTPTKVGSKSSSKSSARDALAIHDAILNCTETLLENGKELLDRQDHICPPTDDESSSSSSSESSSSEPEDGVLTQSPELFPSKSSPSVSFSKSKEKEKQKEKEKKKEEEKEREKEHEKKRKSSLKMSTNSLPYEPMPHGLYVKPNSNKQRKLV